MRFAPASVGDGRARALQLGLDAAEFFTGELHALPSALSLGGQFFFGGGEPVERFDPLSDAQETFEILGLWGEYDGVNVRIVLVPMDHELGAVFERGEQLAVIVQKG
jgi:hypothetical protein